MFLMFFQFTTLHPKIRIAHLQIHALIHRPQLDAAAKEQHGMSPSYSRNCLTLMGLACPTCAEVRSAKEFELVGSRRKDFSAMVPALWNIVSPQGGIHFPPQPSKRALKPALVIGLGTRWGLCYSGGVYWIKQKIPPPSVVYSCHLS